MTKREAERRFFLTQNLTRLGFTVTEVTALRRISATLHNWFEMECGSDHGAIERGGPNGEGRPHYRSRWSIDHDTPLDKCPIIPDRETGARKRLAAICKPHTRKVVPYVQTDPRGVALYLVSVKKLRETLADWAKRNPNTPKGAMIEGYYSSFGIAVY
jgi:hypothetical protein